MWLRKTVFRAATRRHLIPESPFAEVKAGNQINTDRWYFVTLQVAEQVIDACPDAQ
jgi:hypothetical protein